MEKDGLSGLSLACLYSTIIQQKFADDHYVSCEKLGEHNDDKDAEPCYQDAQRSLSHILMWLRYLPSRRAEADKASLLRGQRRELTQLSWGVRDGSVRRGWWRR